MARKILIVDDDRSGVILMESRLAKAGYEVITAFDGKQGLELASESLPDLIVLDVEMPGINGYEFVNAIKQDAALKDVAIIVLTSHDENRPIFRRKGVLNYLIKPVSFDELLLQIRRLIGA